CRGIWDPSWPTFICKPDSGCQGRGIFITRNSAAHLSFLLSRLFLPFVSQPFLIDGFKFDMRIYVLVTSCDPLKIFVYKEGLARFATMRYIEPSSSNLDDICMHLTNYSINKHNENFVRDDTVGSKRKLSTVNAWMMDNSYNTKKLWEDIEDIVIKTLISAHPVVKHNYQSCFPNHTTGCACFEILACLPSAPAAPAAPGLPAELRGSTDFFYRQLLGEVFLKLV
uniref:Uncharacterized protein n=1 Tax=Nothoprocta perdicaria TaxID=30464 RepID=A0A8C6ZGJ7_NOTPE